MWHRAKRINLHTDYKPLPVKYKTINGIETAYREHGNPDGIKVFAIPSWPFAGSVYSPLSMALEDHINMISIDLPGLGGHSQDFDKKGTVHNYKEHVTDFISSFDFDSFSLTGYSMGGVIAHIIASDLKLSPDKMVLISTLFNGVELANKSRWFLDLNKLLRERINTPKPILKLMVADYILRTGHRGFYYSRYKDSLALKSFIRESLQMDVSAAIDVLVSLMTDLEVKGWIPENIQSLILYADGDSEAFKKESIAMAEHVGIESIVLDNTDHHHLFYDVNKSSDILLNFFLA